MSTWGDSNLPGISVIPGSVKDLGSHLLIDTSAKTITTLARSTFSKRVANTPILFQSSYKDEVYQEWWFNGCCHNPHGPAITHKNDLETRITHLDKKGFEHNANGPSSIVVSEDIYEESWKVSPGIHHREGDLPASTNTYYYTKHQLHDVPIILQNMMPGLPKRYIRERTRSWMKHGHPYRSDGGPTEIGDHVSVDATEIINTYDIRIHRFTLEKVFLWYDDSGNFNRTNGPAVITLHEVNESVINNVIEQTRYKSFTTQWWYKGKKIPDENIKGWMRIHKVMPIEGAPINNSVFTSDEDEFCFYTDVLSKV